MIVASISNILFHERLWVKNRIDITFLFDSF